MRTAHYRAGPSIGVVSALLPPKIGWSRSISTIVGRCRTVTVDFNRRRPILGGINRGRKKKREKKNLESSATLRPRNPSSAVDFFSHREEKTRLPAWGEGTRRRYTQRIMVHYRPKSPQLLTRHSYLQAKIGHKANQTRAVKLTTSPLLAVQGMYTNRRTQTNMSISSNTLFTFLSVTFSPTYSFDVLVKATVDAASSRILLNLQSSALAATRPFGSQPLSVAAVEYTSYCLLRSLVEHSRINPKSLVFGYLDEKLIDTGLLKFLGLCPFPLSWYLVFASAFSTSSAPFRPILSLYKSKGSMTPRKSRLCQAHGPTIHYLAFASLPS
ncbi:hypothetical protein BHE74_00012714 [Ensete ventricosum]|nr:hypothetical protein BHE74_00012714 [Ensete ventricosum]